MRTAVTYILSLALLGGGSVARAEGHVSAENSRGIGSGIPSSTSGVIPGISRGAVQGQGQGQQGLQNLQGNQNQDRLGQMLQSIKGMNQSASGGGAAGGGGGGGAGRGAGKGDGPIEIGKKASEFFEQATKANSEAFKQLNQSFQQSQDKNKPNPDNAKITEGLAEDQQKLAEANAKAPPVGSEIVADLIKGINERSDTAVKTTAQIGLQMAPPAPGTFAAPAPKTSIADRLQGLQLASVPATRSTFSAGDKLIGGVNEAIPALPGGRIGANNIGHAFMASSSGSSSIPQRIDTPARGAFDDSSSGGGNGGSFSNSGSGFAPNNFNIVRASGSSGGSSGSSVFDNVGKDSRSADRVPSSVKASAVGAIDGMIGGGAEDAPAVKKRSGRGARDQLLRRVPASNRY